MTPEQKVALDAMREAWPEETVARMLRAVDGLAEQKLVRWQQNAERDVDAGRARWTIDHACRECLPEGGDMVSATFLCMRHYALTLPDPWKDLSSAENQTAQSTPQPPAETRGSRYQCITCLAFDGHHESGCDPGVLQLVGTPPASRGA